MAENSARRWTLPLTALLFVNTVLVGLAMRHVGFAGEPEAAVAVVAPPIEQQPTQPEEEPTVEPPAPVPEALAEEGTLTIWAEVAEVVPDWQAGLEAGAVEMICPIATPSTGDRAQQPTAQASSVPPAVVATDVANPSPEACPEFLVIINPPETRGIVHFVVDGEVINLAPGELRQLPAKESLRVQFHRGDEFGDAEHRCQCGVFAFAVGDDGWKLEFVEGLAATRLLNVCRPAAVSVDNDLD